MTDLARPAMHPAASPPRRTPLGWPWWALFVQTSIAGVVIFVLFVMDVVLVVSRVIQSAPSAVTSPSEADDGALGIFVIPIIVGIAAALPTVAVVTVAVLLGLPVRLIATARVWVVKHRWVPFACALLGVVVFVGAEAFRPDASWPTAVPFFEPSSLPVGVSTLLVAVGLSNFWVPRR
ncbi:hypothetical protein KNO15_00125 [Leifsonia shinshuensis]|uniref:hypothetical protein n=1 Tax=Leifsonia shinshuensis TaxID=150026 RepID=UPI001F512267|nr:hypothetical protein [Leifsonia shinshuensis]MCI0155108.1 hypothetical protein [Leifsonia shinshuensis]